jgi:hypothetical protein
LARPAGLTAPLSATSLAMVQLTGPTLLPRLVGRRVRKAHDKILLFSVGRRTTIVCFPMSALFFVIAVFCFVSSVHAADLIRLPGQATSPASGAKNKNASSAGNEVNFAGWLVLNGASFQNAEFPELSNVLQQRYGPAGAASDSKVTPLPFEPFEVRPTGDIARGYAICPSKALCGDRVGAIMPFILGAPQ